MNRPITDEYLREWIERLQQKRRRELLLGQDGAFLDVCEAWLAERGARATSGRLDAKGYRPEAERAADRLVRRGPPYLVRLRENLHSVAQARPEWAADRILVLDYELRQRTERRARWEKFKERIRRGLRLDRDDGND